MEDENFRHELEDLFRLFKILIEKESEEGLQGMDPDQMEKLKAFMTQFDGVKDKLKIEMVHVDPFTKMMVSALVQQLREHLGPEAEVEAQPSAEEVVNQRAEELKAIADEAQRGMSLIETIDEQLKNPNLSDAEIDALLDKRTLISRKMLKV